MDMDGRAGQSTSVLTVSLLLFHCSYDTYLLIVTFHHWKVFPLRVLRTMWVADSRMPSGNDGHTHTDL
eukprot:3061865-Pyramimonas_sp.AAC.1